ncbi:MAG: DUF2798 domain-containing protein [Spirochaetaceae bacterium]|jgi:hypothetical protein|nr:DUF2798 domain-containing protein [Spirochaetaceae bacterium]
MTLRQILFSGFWTALIMSLCIAFVITAANAGLGGRFTAEWLANAAVGFIISLPLSFFLPPLLMKIMKLLKI